MSFAIIARLEAVVFLGLFVILLFAPGAYAPTYGVAADEGVRFITQRAAPMFLAPAVVLWVAAAAPRSPLRDAVAAGVGVTMLGIAVTGVMAWGQGVTSATILVAAALEVVMAVLIWVSRKN